MQMQTYEILFGVLSDVSYVGTYEKCAYKFCKTVLKIFKVYEFVIKYESIISRCCLGL